MPWKLVIIMFMNILYVYMFMKKKYIKWHFKSSDQLLAYSVCIYTVDI